MSRKTWSLCSPTIFTTSPVSSHLCRHTGGRNLLTKLRAPDELELDVCSALSLERDPACRGYLVAPGDFFLPPRLARPMGPAIEVRRATPP